MRAASRRDAGFTLLELMLVTGLLSGFLLMLVQMLDTGVGVVNQGERSQEIADLRQRGARQIERALQRMIGPLHIHYDDPRPADTRLLVTWEPLGLVDGVGAQSLPVLRATVALRSAEERALWERQREVVDAAEGDQLLQPPLRGLGEMILFPWPSAAGESFFDLRQAFYLTEEEQAPMSGDLFGSDDFDTAELLARSRLCAVGLLHLEYRLWGPETRDWELSAGEGGPERVWDSARAGTLMDENAEPEQVFHSDLGAFSLEDDRDDLFPRWLQVRVSFTDPQRNYADARLAEELLAGGIPEAVLDTAERLPDPAVTGRPVAVKVGREWLRYGAVRGRTLFEVERGLRGTVAGPHPLGARVRLGRDFVVEHALPHGRER